MKLLIFCLFLTSFAYAQKKVAVVKIIRGEVNILTMGKTNKLKVDDWVEDGAVVKTAEKSFAKLVFIDKSQMNVGPNSEMKIEKFSGDDAGVIDLVKGKIRSQVTKDYLQIKDKDKSKLFIKTPNAVMGIRGTDFMISTNGQNTAAILFEGEVVFNKLDNRHEVNSERLENVVDRGVRMHPGEFSVVERNRPEPTVPSLLNIQQRESLEKNTNFESDRAPGNSGNESASKSVVPAGLSGQLVSNDSPALKNEVAQVTSVKTESPVPASSNPDGYIAGDKVKPANGSFVHVESGLIIPPGPNSVLDSNTNTYIAGPDSGKVGTDGSYIPPKNMEITPDGKILVATVNHEGKTIVTEVEKPRPIKDDHPSSLPSAGPVADKPQAVSPPNDILGNGLPSPNDPTLRNNVSGGVSDVSTAVQNNVNGPRQRTVIVRPGPVAGD